MDIIYLDFQKAFDKIPHKRLLHKLAAHGIGGELLLWIENWLFGRKQRVTLSVFQLERCFNWSSTRFGIRANFVFNLY